MVDHMLCSPHFLYSVWIEIIHKGEKNMKKLGIVSCVECCSEFLRVSDYNKAVELWERILSSNTIDAYGKRILIFDEHVYHSQKILAQKYSDHLEKFDDGTPKGVGKRIYGLPVDIFVCYECLNSTYSKEYIKAKLSSTYYKHCKDMKIISLRETVCPVCGKKPEIFGDPYEYYDSKVDNYILSIKNKTEIATNNKEYECSKSEEIDVKTYLKNVIDISSNILFLEDRIKEIYPEVCINRAKVFNGIVTIRNQPGIHEKISEYRKSVDTELENKKKELDALDDYSPSELRELSEKFGLEVLVEPAKPQKPEVPEKPEVPVYQVIDTSKLIKPTEPIMEKPGLFNKKKVMEANKIAQENYNRQVQEYELELYKESLNSSAKSNYERSLSEYEDEMEKYRRELKQYSFEYEDYKNRYKYFEKKKLEIIEKDKDSRNAKKSELMSTINSLEDRKRNINKEIESGAFFESILEAENEDYRESKTYLKLYENELNELSQELTKQYGVLKSLLELDVLFPKYNDIIAWSTMYEYFVTGRVERLSGPAGAYNLYENELRANIIIAKMDVIIEKLDQIKNNQYILYSTLTKISEEARELSDKMDEMLNASQETNRLLGDIYQTEQGIAYNTAKIAKYSKMEAQATKAIAFMTAIWG